MGNYSENREQKRVERLVKLFIDSTEKGLSRDFNESDMQDIILYFMAVDDEKYCKLAIEHGISTFPDDYFFRILRAKYFILNDRLEDAERELQYVETHFPPSPELYLEKVMLAQQAGDSQVHILNLLQKSLALDDTFPETHLMCASEYLIDDKLSLAVRHAKKALQLDPTLDEDLKFLVGGLNALQPNMTTVINFFLQLIKYFPMSGHLWEGLGSFYELDDQYINAIEAYQYQATLQPENFIIFYQIGKCYMELEDFESALKNFERAREKTHDMTYNAIIGHCYFKMKEYDTALPYLLKTNMEFPDHYIAIQDAIQIFKEKGNLADARKILLDNLYNPLPDIDIFKKSLTLSDPEMNLKEMWAICQEFLMLLDPKTDLKAMCTLCHEIIDIYQDPDLIFHFLIPFCCKNEYYELGLTICKEYVDDPQLYHSIGYYLAALNILNGQIKTGCDYLKNAILISPENCLHDFVYMDTRLRDFPQVAAIIEANDGIFDLFPNFDNEE